MSGLAQQQAALLQALWQPRHADAMKDIAEFVRSPGANDTNSTNHCERGLRAYRSNGHALAQRVLAAAYPVVLQLLGDENFEPLARRHWLRHPPERGDLAQWGAAFADDLAAVPGLAEEQPYLPDVARLEWALHAAATAADREPDRASFSLLVEADPERLALVLGPGVQSLASGWPVVSIVHAYLLGEPAPEQASELIRDAIAESALVWRQGLAPRLRQAQPGEAAFVAALQESLSLADSLSMAPDFDFNAWLTPAVQSGLLLAVRNIDTLEENNMSLNDNPVARTLVSWWNLLAAGLDSLRPAAALAARLYVGQAFFLSGLTKIRDWDTTLALFADEYKVPLLPTGLAALMGTGGELLLPVLLVLGLGGRFAALGLFVVNLVAVVSLSEIAPAALQQHVFWGALLAGIAIFGPGAWSLDRWVWPRLAVPPNRSPLNITS